MAEHLGLQTLKRVKALLVDQTRAKANVEVGRITNVRDVDAIDILVGPASPTSQFGFSTTGNIDAVHRFWIDLHTRSLLHDEAVVENLFEMWTDVHRRLLADATLGLPFVFTTRWLGSEDFDLMYAGERIGAMRTVWDVGYKMVYTDPTI